MRAGRLRNLCVFETQSAGDDGYSNTTGAWDEKCRAYGRLLAQTGREVLESGQHEGQTFARLWVRANSQTRLIKSADRVTVKGKIWQIKTPASGSEKNEELEFLLVGVDR